MENDGQTEQKTLYVVYEHTDKAGGLAGNRYMTLYDEQLFKKTVDSTGEVSRDGSLRVVAKGIESSVAEGLCSQVSLRTQLSGARQLSMERNGAINPLKLEMETVNVLLSLRQRPKKG